MESSPNYNSMPVELYFTCKLIIGEFNKATFKISLGESIMTNYSFWQFQKLCNVYIITEHIRRGEKLLISKLQILK